MIAIGRSVLSVVAALKIYRGGQLKEETCEDFRSIVCDVQRWRCSQPTHAVAGVTPRPGSERGRTTKARRERRPTIERAVRPRRAIGAEPVGRCGRASS